ncbi:hypothetical protein IT409_01705 [Candidatus Falkowbacteria bacterium]|nr:hypothetical protein [Candidatus Falkowbacteria bacterium]
MTKQKSDKTPSTETSLQKRLFELHAQVDSRSDEEQRMRVLMQSAKLKKDPWRRKSHRR